jgi:mRNA-degrading endonuclease RelE of RelBE toxin-antitoxin system
VRLWPGAEIRSLRLPEKGDCRLTRARRRCRRRAGRRSTAWSGFRAEEYHRLRAGSYRVVYIVEADLITVSRVDRVRA